MDAQEVVIRTALADRRADFYINHPEFAERFKKGLKDYCSTNFIQGIAEKDIDDISQSNFSAEAVLSESRRHFMETRESMAPYIDFCAKDGVASGMLEYMDSVGSLVGRIKGLVLARGEQYALSDTGINEAIREEYGTPDGYRAFWLKFFNLAKRICAERASGCGQAASETVEFINGIQFKIENEIMEEEIKEIWTERPNSCRRYAT